MNQGSWKSGRSKGNPQPQPLHPQFTPMSHFNTSSRGFHGPIWTVRPERHLNPNPNPCKFESTFQRVHRSWLHPVVLPCNLGLLNIMCNTQLGVKESAVCMCRYCNLQCNRTKLLFLFLVSPLQSAKILVEILIFTLIILNETSTWKVHLYYAK